MPLVRVDCRTSCRDVVIPDANGNPIGGISCKQVCGSISAKKSRTAMMVDTTHMSALDIINAIAPTYHTTVNGRRVTRTLNPPIVFAKEKKT